MELLLPWFVLTVGTLLSWWLDASVNSEWVGTGVLLIAFFKARLVLVHFMGVSSAPGMVRWFCEGWAVVACSLLIAFYWLLP